MPMKHYSEYNVIGGITLTKGNIKTVNIFEYLEFGFITILVQGKWWYISYQTWEGVRYIILYGDIDVLSYAHPYMEIHIQIHGAAGK